MAVAAGSSAFGIIGRFFGRTVSEAAAFGAGLALGPVLGPPTQALRNTVNAAYPFVPVRPNDAAAIVAEDVEQLAWGQTEASYAGLDGARFGALVGEALNAPGAGELFQLWRRGLIGDGDFTHGLRKGKLEGRWDGPLRGLRDTLLSSEELANLQQQGFVDAARADSEGALQGVNAERQQLRFEASGLPPGWAEGLTMLRRGIIGEPEFERIVREGHTKTKYTGDLLKLRTQVLSAVEYAGLRLRGWIDDAAMNAGGALTGYTPEQMRLLFEGRGRPATPHQMWLANRRSTATRADFDRAIVQSDIRPEYAQWLWDTRYNYPSLFQLRRLAEAGTLPPARILQILLYEGYEEQDARAMMFDWTAGAAGGAKAETRAELLDSYAGGYLTEAALRTALTQLGYAGAVLDQEVHLGDARRVKRWREKAVDAIGKAYIAHEIDDASALADLAQAGVTGQAAQLLMPYWQLERRVAIKQLTPAQIKRAYRKALISQADAVTRLVDHGYTAADANVYLAS